MNIPYIGFPNMAPSTSLWHTPSFCKTGPISCPHSNQRFSHCNSSRSLEGGLVTTRAFINGWFYSPPHVFFPFLFLPSHSVSLTTCPFLDFFLFSSIFLPASLPLRLFLPFFLSAFSLSPLGISSFFKILSLFY